MPASTAPAHQSYVLGFMFDPSKQRVALIHKERPAWQKGSLNGIGGKIERGETPEAAMVREFAEETGVHTTELDWRPLGALTGAGFAVHCYASVSDQLEHVRSLTDERIEVFDVQELFGAQRPLMQPNLPTLLAHALDPQAPWLQLQYAP